MEPEPMRALTVHKLIVRYLRYLDSLEFRDCAARTILGAWSAGTAAAFWLNSPRGAGDLLAALPMFAFGMAVSLFIAPFGVAARSVYLRRKAARRESGA